jgi:hypothetical protein
VNVFLPPEAVFDELRLLAAVEGLGRAAANSLELGWTHDDGPRPGEWYASARYKGARVIVENQHGPDDAAEALLFKVAAGGECVHCGSTITVSSNGLTLTISGHPVLDEDVLEETGTSGLCVWKRDGAHWLRGCDGGYGPPPAGLNRAQRRRQARAKAMRR